MHLIKLSDSNGQIRLDFSGCNLKCPYCIHIRQPSEDHSIEEIVELAKNSDSKNVFLGGAEPTLQKELIPLVEALHDLGKHIILKSDGMMPEVLQDALPFVDGFVLELKCPLDDVDATMELTGVSEKRVHKYIDMLERSLQICKSKWLRIWIRVIPEYVNMDTMPRITPYIEGATEVMLYQFLSNPEFDIPFKGHSSPVPSWDELEELGKLTLDTVPRVVLVGERGKVVLER